MINYIKSVINNDGSGLIVVCKYVSVKMQHYNSMTYNNNTIIVGNRLNAVLLQCGV